MFQQTIISMPYLTTNSAKCWYLNGKQFKLNWMFWRVPHTYILGSCCESASASLTISCGCLDSQSAIYMHLSNQTPKMSWFGTWSLFSSLVLWLSITWFWNSCIFFLYVRQWPILYESVVILKLLCSLCCTGCTGYEESETQTKSNNNKKKPHDLSYSE